MRSAGEIFVAETPSVLRAVLALERRQTLWGKPVQCQKLTVVFRQRQRRVMVQINPRGDACTLQRQAGEQSSVTAI